MMENSCTKTFYEVFPDYETFESAYGTSPLADAVSDENLEVLYYLLYAKYGNNHITNLDENQFKFKVFSTIWKYGPAWEKKLNVQANLRDISEDNLLVGAKAIYNHAYNPGTDPSTASLTELTYINDQNTTNYKKSKMDAYTQLLGILATDVTEEFLIQFKPLFKKFISPFTVLYESEE